MHPCIIMLNSQIWVLFKLYLLLTNDINLMLKVYFYKISSIFFYEIIKNHTLDYFII